VFNRAEITSPGQGVCNREDCAPASLAHYWALLRCLGTSRDWLAVKVKRQQVEHPIVELLIYELQREGLSFDASSACITVTGIHITPSSSHGAI
jgi:hypothetical protein